MMKTFSLTADAQDVISRIDAIFLPKDAPHKDAGRLAVGAATYATHESSDNSKDQTAETANISLQKLEHVSDALDAYLSSLGVNLKFHIDERTDKVQVEVREPKTDKLIRKIPADEVLEMAASIEQMMGLFWDKTL